MRSMLLALGALLAISCNTTSPEETGSSHSLRVTKPNGGEVYSIGQTIHLQLSAKPQDGGYMAVVQWSWDGGNTWVLVSEENPTVAVDSIAGFDVVIPDSVSYFKADAEGNVIKNTVPTKSSKWLVYAYDYDRHSQVSDTSDGFFTIK